MKGNYKLSRKSYDIEEVRERVYLRDDGICQKCKKKGGLYNFQLAHRIMKGSQSERTIMNFIRDKYQTYITRVQAREILNHEDNLQLMCPGDCNDSANIFFNPVERDELIKKIWESIQ